MLNKLIMDSGIFAGLKRILTGMTCYQARPSMDIDNLAVSTHFDSHEKDISNSSGFNSTSGIPDENISQCSSSSRKKSLTVKENPDFKEFHTEPTRNPKHLYGNKRKSNNSL